MPRSVAVCLLLGSMLACSGEDPKVSRSGGSAGESGDGTSVPFCAALDVVRAKCHRCHGSERMAGAPASFVTFDDFHAPYADGSEEWWQVMINAVSKDLMPYVGANLTPPVEPLTSEEKKTLLDWLNEGAKPVGGTDCP